MNEPEIAPPHFECCHCGARYVYEPRKELAFWGVTGGLAVAAGVGTGSVGVGAYVGLTVAVGAAYSLWKYARRACPKCYRSGSRPS